MPIVEGLVTKSAKTIWSSPDGNRTIYEVVFDYQGKEFVAKTYSEVIATEGWKGNVLTDERENKRTGGMDTFVKTAPKEGFTGGGGSNRSGGRQLADPFTMYLSYAKDLAIAAIHEGNFDSRLYSEMLEAVAAGGAQLYETRPDAEAKPAEKNNETVSMEDLSKVLGDIKEDEGETPWDKKTR